MPSPRAPHLDPPPDRVDWLTMLLGVFRRSDRDGLYRELIAEIERLIAAAEREGAVPGGERVR